MQIDLDHLKSWIGREEHAQEALTSALVARFNATFDRSSCLDDGADAPLLIHLCLGQPTVPTADLGLDGHPARGGFLPPIPLPRRMWAGGAIEFHAPLKIGEVVKRRSFIQDVVVKQGRSGALCFVTVLHSFDCCGRQALTERQDIVYRGAPTEGAAPVENLSVKAPVGTSQKQISASAPFLFRYSALTFNGHRIHYDAPYTIQEEHYPGLIVHGPLQATLLCQYAADLRGAAPKSFRFRSATPIFGPGDFNLNATQKDDALTLWTALPGGPISMEAVTEW